MSAAEAGSQTVDIILPLERSEDADAWRQAVGERLGVLPGRVREMRLRKHSIDSRQRQIKVQLRLEVALDEASLPDEPVPRPSYPTVPEGAPRVVIVGCGPAGMFAALRCLELGCRPVILERGKDASSRRFDLAPILRHGRVVEDSNYCFGEGGAGTFSDGKLYTRATKRGPVRTVYETLVAHGSPERILVDAHPHIGSNLLPKVVMAMRASILAAGGEVHFGARVEGLLRSADRGHLRGVRTADGREFTGESVILATGHSARDIYRLLDAEGVRLEAKPFAVGVRIEHPQPLIDRLQYHLARGVARPALLPAASYRLATKIRDRGVHSFCMCPGGFIVPAATENDEVVVNGMSLSRRDSPFANSGLVVTVEPEDVAALRAEHGELAGIAFQRALETAAARAGGGGQKAPGQRALDFIEGRLSEELPETSYFPGLTPAPLHELLPPFIVARMREGLRQFGRSKPGYLGPEANLVGFETRTSSPVRIPRDPKRLEHPELAGLFPCGEGAGYAGGIVSAALDGLRCAEAAVALTAGG
ncbi:MAG: NAD(P)/FAD-dependent oxidoreductase [Opitutales bacterium]